MHRMKSSLFVYGFSALITFGVAVILKFVFPVTSYMYTFFFNSWPIQFLSTWLFFMSVCFWIQRYSSFKKEEISFQKIHFPQKSILCKDVSELLRTIPDHFKSTLTMRRVQELLRGFVHGEDVIRLNEELSRRDMAEVERGHLTLDVLRNLIPVIGFLGTVVGLSFAMIAFPQVSDPQALKQALQNFAASLSVAFNTTLLALAYTIVLIMLNAFLRQREETLVGDVDSETRKLIGKIKIEQGFTAPILDSQKIADSINNAIVRFEKELSVAVQNALLKVGDGITTKLDDIKGELRKPPQYQVVVQPLTEKEYEK